MMNSIQRRPSCENCRRAHKGCNREGPPCGRCIQFGLEKTCHYNVKNSPIMTLEIPPEPKKSIEKPTKEEKKQKKNINLKKNFVGASSFIITQTARGKSGYPYEDRLLSDDFYVNNLGRFPSREPYNVKFLIVNPESDSTLVEMADKALECFPIRNLDAAIESVKSELPKPSFHEVSNYDNWIKTPTKKFKPVLEWERPGSYILYNEKSSEEQDELCEYDMDSEDETWLLQYNKERKKQGLPLVSDDDFEVAIDRLEKESFLRESIQSPPYEEDIDAGDCNCCICNDGTSDDTNQIVFCDGCDIPVHQECYGIRYIPEGLWFCQKCMSEETNVDCILCPKRGGAYKRTTDGKWAHVACALWVPETIFTSGVNGAKGEVDGIPNIPKARWNLLCSICKRKEGACVQCKERTCATAFHVSCAQAAGYSMQTREKNGYPRYTAYCERHAPKKQRTQPSDVYEEKTSQSNRGKKQKKKKSERPKKKFLEIFAHDIIPLSVAEKVVKNLPANSIQGVWKYWVEKRKSRSGNPLLKRLSKTILFSPRYIPKKGSNDVKERKEALEKLHFLRRDLEKCRIILEIVKKREITKKQLVQLKVDLFEIQSLPKVELIHFLITTFENHDKNHFFQEEPSKENFPDYYDKILQPMSFNRVRKKLTQGNYSEEQFWEDVLLICKNTFTYYSPTTLIYKEAKKMQKLIQIEKNKLENFTDDWKNGRYSQNSKSPQNHGSLEMAMTKRKPFKQDIKTIPPLTESLHYVLDRLERADTLEIFKYPVSVQKVPTYRTVIDTPMDLSLMRRKLENESYNTIAQFKHDFNLMINNATTFNPPTTIFYQEAKTLCWLGTRLLNKLEADENIQPDSNFCNICNHPRDRNKLVHCDICDDCYHIYCLHPPIRKVPRNRWFCARCDPHTHCNICNLEKDDSQMLLCDLCNRGYHIYCLDPPLQSIPQGSWFCNICDPRRRCNRCGNSKNNPKMVLCASCQKSYHIYCLKPQLENVPESQWFCISCQITQDEESITNEKEEEKDFPKYEKITTRNPSPKQPRRRMIGACPEHKKKKKRCPENCPGRKKLENQVIKKKSESDSPTSPSWSQRRKKHTSDDEDEFSSSDHLPKPKKLKKNLFDYFEPIPKESKEEEKEIPPYHFYQMEEEEEEEIRDEEEEEEEIRDEEDEEEEIRDEEEEEEQREKQEINNLPNQLEKKEEKKVIPLTARRRKSFE